MGPEGSVITYSAALHNGPVRIIMVVSGSVLRGNSVNTTAEHIPLPASVFHPGVVQCRRHVFVCFFAFMGSESSLFHLSAQSP